MARRLFRNYFLRLILNFCCIPGVGVETHTIYCLTQALCPPLSNLAGKALQTAVC